MEVRCCDRGPVWGLEIWIEMKDGAGSHGVLGWACG